MGLWDGFLSLGAKVNKVDGDDVRISDGDIGDRFPALKIEKSDKELLKIAKAWQKAWEGYKGKITKRQEKNKNYWLGKHFEEAVAEKRNAIVDNRIFTDVETLIPIVAGQNPEPLVLADNSESGDDLAGKVAKHLAYQADTQKLKLIIQQSTRNWMLDLIGVVKYGWDIVEDDIETKILSVRKLILDPDATIGVRGYTGGYVGEFKKERADKVIRGFPNMEKVITEKVGGEMWTEIEFIEWWTADVLFWTFREEVMGKIKNPHWNYDEDQSVPDFDEAGFQKLDSGGEPQDKIITTPGKNHFKTRRMPYTFLAGLFNTGEHPHDDTSLIEQVIPQQDLINKRQRQLDKNADQTNGGLVLDSNVFTKEQGAQAANALRTGGAILAPGGVAAVKRETGTPLPSFITQTLQDYRAEIDNIMGIHATTKGEAPQTKTLGGQILLEQADKTRASSITVWVEQFADEIFNWWTQLMYVYYDVTHTAAILGEEKKEEFIALINDDMIGKLLVSVKEGSMIPKDPLTKRGEAIDLWKAGALDPLSLFVALDHPDPKAAAERLFQHKKLEASGYAATGITGEGGEVSMADGVTPPPVAI